LAGTPGGVIYASAKAAVHEYTRCLAAQVQTAGVHVNCVAPGDITTERFRASRPLDAARQADTSLARYGVGDDIADTVAFLVSPASSYITGQVIRIDGGKQVFPA
jgi:3-oxoacyl-[acyl-carrier protein] reductase